MNKADIVDYYQSIYGREPTEAEINAELKKADDSHSEHQQTGDSSTDTTAGVKDTAEKTDADLNERVKQLEAQLAQQKGQQQQINVIERVVPNREHFIQVLEFMKDNAISLFIVFIIAIIAPAIRWWLLLIYLVFVYFYPLLSTNKRFWWDKKLDDWFHDKDNLKNIYKSTSNSLSSINQTIHSNHKDDEQADAHQQELIKEMQAARSDSVTPNDPINDAPTAQIIHQGFRTSGELILGIVALICGTPMFFIGRNSVSDAGTQISSVLSNGSLDSSGYLYIIGMFLMGIGVLALIGGIVKGATGHTGGGLAKVLGFVLGVIIAGVACYVYANPVDSAVSAAQAAYNSGASMDDISTAYKAVKIVPWIAAGLYGLGILLNAMHAKQR